MMTPKTLAALGISQEALKLVEETQTKLTTQFQAIEHLQLQNQAKVLAAFRKHQIEGRHFAGTTGYAYGDIGRDTLDALWATVFGCEAALVRPHIVSGTHALSLCLYALCRRGVRLISLTGAPYDTLQATVGIHPDENGIESILGHGAEYRQIELTADRQVDLDAACTQLKASGSQQNVVYLQRSRGYDWRPSLTVQQIADIISAVKDADPNCTVLVDNCYGEFTETQEPTDVGADLIAGSLIKNPGGGLAPTGGYIAGRRHLVERVQYRMTAPGIGAEVGSWPQGYQSFYQGLFLAPHTVGESLKGAVLAAALFESIGFPVMPASTAQRSDITQSIEFGAEEPLLRFCRAIQAASPVDGHAVPEPWPMPGYQHDVVMAAGTFVQGASIELSADAPIRAPYIGYLQGGLTYQHCALAMMRVLTELEK